MTLDTMSDLTRDILELADNDITDKVRPRSADRSLGLGRSVSKRPIIRCIDVVNA